MRISRIPQFRSLGTQSIKSIIAAIVLSGISSALAQNDYTRGGPAAPAARVGNIYDHQRHQPTERDVRAAKKAAGIPLPSSRQQGAGRGGSEEPVATDRPARPGIRTERTRY